MKIKKVSNIESEEEFKSIVSNEIEEFKKMMEEATELEEKKHLSKLIAAMEKDFL